jgi:acetyl/propionyl-CoA carboxylase alpha subunit/acetyl-CoA carboxylase alpha subunit
MARRISGLDQLFLMAEQRASDFSLFPKAFGSSRAGQIAGLLSARKVDQRLAELRNLTVDQYIAETVTPSEDKARPGAKAILKRLGTTVREFGGGPLYAAEVKIEFGDSERHIGFLCQERGANNGVWGPEHHLQATDVIRRFTQHRLPIVTMIDTPGADAGEEANRNNQAHAISRLIAEMALLHVPTVGIVIGNGYSGGAIPLATTNVLLSVRDGVFNTIQPQGLASIARKYDLSWQECAKYVGVSSYELYSQGYLDGVIDFVPTERKRKLENLRKAIVSSIAAVEQGAEEFIPDNPEVFDHYRRSVYRYLDPAPDLEQVERQSALWRPTSPTGQLDVFGCTYRYLRYLGLRGRIRSTTTERYGRLATTQLPKGDLKERQRQDYVVAFHQWLENPLEIRYDDNLNKSWKTFLERRASLGTERGKIMKILRGNPATRFYQARSDLYLHYSFYLFNLWKSGAHNNFLLLIEQLRTAKAPKSPDEGAMTVLDVMMQDELRDGFIKECQNLIIFELIYDNIITNQIAIAREVKDMNVVSRDSVNKLLEEPLEKATVELAAKQPDDQGASRRLENELKDQFYLWLNQFIHHGGRGQILKTVQEWKKIVFPRISEPLFAIITFFFEHLLPEFYECEISKREYEGRISPRDIGMKDFWNRLAIAYQDILIGDALYKVKRSRVTTSKAIIERFFTNFDERNANLMTADPVNFPGFRISIEQALSRDVTPCGLITGVAQFKSRKVRRKMGVAISNLDFQAGAFDMASCEKFCKLLVECARRHLPVVCFLSSGGMQTKEGAGSLFSMAIVNDRITRFVRDNHLPIIIFGFGDCTGGAQASLVTHPLVQTYYFSGTNMPFAGQIVVPAYLPTTATLSNYLSVSPGAMQGLVSHPFAETLDDDLREIDKTIPVAEESVEEVVQRIIQEGVLADSAADGETPTETVIIDSRKLLKPVRKVLIHARGCTAVKLIRIAQRNDISVVLVQSDADMDSVSAEMLTENDTLVCLGGNTPDESYLNAASVIRLAEREGVDSLHPGIGFLSENAHFSALCQFHKINFIGPSARSMELMGNKSNAINTALRLKIPVVPGSHGIITSVEAAQALSDEISYPVILKAVHGGGGKGIQIVEDPADFRDSFLKISAEAKSAFGNSDVYIEKCVVSLRHCEVQIIRDSFGNTKVLGMRDCSVQRNNQKIIEESGSTMLPKKIEEQMYKSASDIADDIGYVGAGTVEFIYDIEAKTSYFMEMNTRLQVEHPVTEVVSGVDIVKAQYDIAGGERIDQLEAKPKGYAIETRVTAEKATVDSAGKLSFIPHPGQITTFDLPECEHIDIIATAAEGKAVTPFYDSMIAQIICYGKDREDAIEKLLAYLDSVTICGVCTNIPLVRRILTDEVFRKGIYDTRYLIGLFERIDLAALSQEIDDEAGVAELALDLGALRIENSDELKVIAPSTGVFYMTPSPSEPDFVTPGAIIGVDQTLCLLEAMKVFRSLTLADFNKDDSVIYDPETKFEVIKVAPPGGQAVNVGDLLFVVKPVSNAK